jgi:hypothetical protein
MRVSFSKGGQNNTPALVLRVRRSIDQPMMPMQLRYVGQPELGTLFLIKNAWKKH